MGKRHAGHQECGKYHHSFVCTIPEPITREALDQRHLEREVFEATSQRSSARIGRAGAPGDRDPSLRQKGETRSPTLPVVSPVVPDLVGKVAAEVAPYLF